MTGTFELLATDLLAALEHAPDGMMVTDVELDAPDGPRILYVNEALCRMTGYTAQELLGRTPRVLQGPATSRLTMRRLRRALVAGRPFRGQAMNYRSDGSAFVMEWSIAPVPGPDGQPACFVAIQRDATAFRAALDDAERRAHTDALTGLANRASVEERLKAQPPVAALLIDLDKFKLVNDRFGHAVGDEVLREVADRILGCVRADDLAARYGGEEFAVLLDSATGVDRLAERVRAAIGGRPVITAAGSVRVTASVGAAVSTSPPGDPEELVAQADAALYQAKHAGRDRVHLHEGHAPTGGG